MTILLTDLPMCQMLNRVGAELPPALLASTFRPSNALRAKTFIRLWLTC